MKKGLYQDLEKEWRKLKRLRFFYFVLPLFLIMLCARIVQVYVHLKLELARQQAVSCSRENPEKPAKPVPVPAEKADMQFFTPEPAGQPAKTAPAGSCTVTEEL